MEIKSRGNNWIYGNLEVKGNKFAFSAKVFSEPDEGYGITEPSGEGHISKMDVTHVKEEDHVLRYDREWVFNYLPKTSKKIIKGIEDYVEEKF